MTKAFTLPIQKGGNGVEVPFHKRIIGNVMFIKIDLKQIHNVFCNCCYYFWDQHCCCTETSIIGNDFFCFYKFPLPSTVLLSPCPTTVPASLTAINLVSLVAFQSVLLQENVFYRNLEKVWTTCTSKRKRLNNDKSEGFWRKHGCLGASLWWRFNSCGNSRNIGDKNFPLSSLKLHPIITDH